jgi:plasmid maintenance system antidote protein VapI
MRIALDPAPLVLGIYAHVGELLARAAGKREEGSPHALAKKLTRQRQAADKEVQKLIRAMHTDVKTADKLLKKTADVWKISQETDLVDLVMRARGEEPEPRAYVLLLARDIKPLLLSIAEAARGAGEDEATVEKLVAAANAIEGKGNEYFAFGFDPWEG